MNKQRIVGFSTGGIYFRGKVIEERGTYVQVNGGWPTGGTRLLRGETSYDIELDIEAVELDESIGEMEITLEGGHKIRARVLGHHRETFK